MPREIDKDFLKRMREILGVPDATHSGDGRPGNYLLTNRTSGKAYPGRSDTNVIRRLSESLRERPGMQLASLSFAESPVQAYHRECRAYHALHPWLRENRAHPNPPLGRRAYLRCSICGS